jgi:hypothetical protein
VAVAGCGGEASGLTRTAAAKFSRRGMKCPAWGTPRDSRERTISDDVGMLSALFGREQRMDYEVSLGGSGRYILVKVLVPMTTAVGVSCGSDAVSLGLEKKVDRFLFDLRNSPNVQAVVDNYEFARKEITKFGFPTSSRSAFLVRPDDKSHDFINTAFFNAGFVTKMFSEEAAAIAWLQQETPPSLKRRDWRDDFL